jgi:predicted Rossmann fold nucleotide-binding protein DprA/Smf involved in DNA uptake
MPGTPTSSGAEAKRAAHLAGGGLGPYLTADFVREHGADAAILHAAIARWEQRGHVNSIDELAAATGLEPTEVTDSLVYLHQQGMIELNPDRSRVRVVTK